jgi:hypothetical protein
MTSNSKITTAKTAWMVLDRDTGNSVFTSKYETKARAKCETLNGKYNRERTRVVPFPY